jgi:hypothetical protein
LTHISPAPCLKQGSGEFLSGANSVVEQRADIIRPYKKAQDKGQMQSLLILEQRRFDFAQRPNGAIAEKHKARRRAAQNKPQAHSANEMFTAAGNKTTRKGFDKPAANIVNKQRKIKKPITSGIVTYILGALP